MTDMNLKRHTATATAIPSPLPSPLLQPANKFGYDNKCMSKAFAMDVSVVLQLGCCVFCE